MEERQFINKIYLSSLFPVTLAVLLIQLCSVINNIVVGRLLGSDGLAVTSVVSPISFIFATVGSLLAVGGSIQAAHFVGNQNFDGCNRCLYLTVKLSLVIGVALTAIIMVFNGVVLNVLGVPDSIRKETRNYILAFAPSAFAAIGIYIPFNYLKINGAQKYGVYVSGIMAIVNISLDIVFVKFFNMGMAGIGLASTIAYFSATLPGLFILYSKKGGFKKPKDKSFGGIKDVLISGSPSAVNNLCNLLRTYFLNLIIVSALGKAGLSTFSVISTIFMFSVTISNGTSLSMAPFAAVFSSEKDTKSLRQIFTAAMVSAVVLMTVFVGILEYMPEKICRFFSIADSDALAMATNAVCIFSVSLILSGVNTIFSTFYQSIKHTLFSNALTVLRNFALVVLFALYFSKKGNGENLWYAFLIAEAITFLLTFVISFIISRIRKDLSAFLLMDEVADKSGKFLAFSVDNNNASAAESAEKITGFCEQNEMSPKLTMALGIAIEEILVLFNDHALKDEKTKLRSNVRILIHDDVVVLRFRTAGKQFNPIKYADSDEDLMSDTMGIKMVKKLSEVVLYDRVFGINNLTILF